MEIIAQSKTERISSRKVMLVADVIRTMSVKQALDTLSLIGKRGAKVLIKLINSAVANAVNNAKQNKEILFIKKLEITQGPFLKRFHASTKGRVHPYKKRSSNIKIVLDSLVGEGMKNPNIKIRNPKQISGEARSRSARQMTQMTKIKNSK